MTIATFSIIFMLCAANVSTAIILHSYAQRLNWLEKKVMAFPKQPGTAFLATENE